MNENLELITLSDFQTSNICVLSKLEEARCVDRRLKSQSLADDIAEIAQIGYVFKCYSLTQEVLSVESL